jgi:hypothetical protein
MSFANKSTKTESLCLRLILFIAETPFFFIFYCYNSRKSEKNRNTDEKKNKKSDLFVGNLLFSGLFALNDEDGENGQDSKCTGGGV